MNLSIFKQKRGFTLVELLTVISIIAVLTALLTVSFVSVSQRSKDGQRKSNLRQIQSAFELYRADNDAYPTASVWSTLTCNGQFLPSGTRYMSRLPCDPESPTTSKYNYVPAPAGCNNTTTLCTSYALSSCLDNTSDREGSSTVVAGLTCTPAFYFTVTNP